MSSNTDLNRLKRYITRSACQSFLSRDRETSGWIEACKEDTLCCPIFSYYLICCIQLRWKHLDAYLKSWWSSVVSTRRTFCRPGGTIIWLTSVRFSTPLSISTSLCSCIAAVELNLRKDARWTGFWECTSAVESWVEEDEMNLMRSGPWSEPLGWNFMRL